MAEFLGKKGIVQTEMVEDVWVWRCQNNCGAFIDSDVLETKVLGVVVSRESLLDPEKIRYAPEKEEQVKECQHNFRSLGVIA